eukprot:scaffold65_cov353-Prasinococcus_capsulatus_cf.AAC.25
MRAGGRQLRPRAASARKRAGVLSLCAWRQLTVPEMTVMSHPSPWSSGEAAAEAGEAVGRVFSPAPVGTVAGAEKDEAAEAAEEALVVVASWQLALISPWERPPVALVALAPERPVPCRAAPVEPPRGRSRDPAPPLVAPPRSDASPRRWPAPWPSPTGAARLVHALRRTIIPLQPLHWCCHQVDGQAARRNDNVLRGWHDALRTDRPLRVRVQAVVEVDRHPPRLGRGPVAVRARVCGAVAMLIARRCDGLHLTQPRLRRRTGLSGLETAGAGRSFGGTPVRRAAVPVHASSVLLSQYAAVAFCFGWRVVGEPLLRDRPRGHALEVGHGNALQPRRTHCWCWLLAGGGLLAAGLEAAVAHVVFHVLEAL